MINGSPGNLIGGTSASARNLISGNLNGIYVFTSTAMGNVISGNYIGTSVTGLAALGNVLNGLEIATSSSNLIGGTIRARAMSYPATEKAGFILSRRRPRAIWCRAITSG